MGSLCSKPTADDSPSQATRDARSREQSSVVRPQDVGAPRSSSRQQSSTKTGRDLPQRPIRNRAQSTPHKASSMRDVELSPLQRQRTRAKSLVTLSPDRDPSSDHRQVSAEHSRTSPRRAPMDYPTPRPLNSTVRQVLPEDFKFRILVVGPRRAGKSSLIKAVFKVDVTAEPKDTYGKVDINVEFRPEDNRYLIVHECSGFESQPGDSQNLQIIRDFISHRTDQSRSPSERLHAVWICIPASDAITGRLGEGVEEILGMRTVPVILVFTKFDVVVSQVLFDIARGDARQHKRARVRAHAMYEDCCRRLFHDGVPAEIVSEKPRYADLIENLVVATDRFIQGSRNPSAGFGAQGERPRVSAVRLAWSAALRVSHLIVLQASIEVGRSRYWHRLWSNVDLSDHPLKACVNVIHEDLVEIWNLDDKTRCLSSDGFKAKMSHLIGDLVGSNSVISDPYPTEAEVEFANWVDDVYSGSQANVRCIMGYIVDLTVILDAISSATSGDVSPANVRSVIDRHVSSGNKNKIHRNIQGFVTEAFAIGFSVPQRDLILERIMDLIQEFCVPSSGTG